MKKIIILFVTAFTLLSCSSDDGIGNNENKITINNEDYNISIFSMGNINENNFYIELMANSYFEHGEGLHLSFSMYNSNGTSLDDGVHTFNHSLSRENGTFYNGDYFVQNNQFTSNNFEEIEGEIVSGTVIIEKNNNNYKITIDCINQDGISVTGIYDGNLTDY
ncbi:hypothetical protein BA195_11545 [Tenacibaculum soleae]|uniref:Uncharacterized protein n=1 Tax=Tenacibaculum soleae TaxID=447689 RepID=A0A1B9XXT9_9FLAO|nr:hypothetical protein [Tenacibaculum soleae]OCK42251.1 hypothetical protein BA195_11545 [Tenacibaculum soleae]